jgi:hypothetical protein
MTDPFDILRDRLVAAAEAAPTPARSARRRWRSLVAVAAALVISGSAAAAVVKLTAEDSPPLAGKVAGRPGAGPLGTSHYVIELLPYLSAGRSGWCATVVLHGGKGGPLVGGEGCGPAPPADAPEIAGGAVVATTGSGTSVSYAVVDDRVARVRVDGGREIIPRPSRAIPAGWKAAVWFTAGGQTPSPVVFLNRVGQPISTAPNQRAGTQVAGTAKLPTRAVDPSHPPHQRCAIDVPVRAGLRAVSERVVTATPARPPDINGRAFRTCASAVINFAGRRFTAAVLIDARDPGRQAAPLPGQRDHPGTTGVVEAGGGITARRAGPAWLVVRGSDPGQRLRLLRALSTGA